MAGFKQQLFHIATRFDTGASNDRYIHHMGMDKSTQNGISNMQIEKMIVKEWLSAKVMIYTTDSRVVEWSADSTQPNVTKRYPWEGFYDVGFRTVWMPIAVISATKGDKVG